MTICCVPVLVFRGPSASDFQTRYVWSLWRTVRWRRMVDKSHWVMYATWGLMAVDLWGSWFFLLVVFGVAFNAYWQRKDLRNTRIWLAKAQAAEDAAVAAEPIPQNPSGLF